MTSYYLAGRVSWQERLLSYARTLEGMGHTVTSRWLYPVTELHANRSHMSHEDRRRYAERDLYDIEKADVLILFTQAESEHNHGGRFFEAGYAYGLGRAVWVVGPQENLFTCLADQRRFQTWDDVLRYLAHIDQRDTIPS